MFAARFAGTVAGLGVYAQQDRCFGGVGGLESGGHFARVHRIHTAIAVGGQQERGWVGFTVTYAVVGRVRVEPAELRGVFGVAVLGHP